MSLARVATTLRCRPPPSTHTPARALRYASQLAAVDTIATGVAGSAAARDYAGHSADGGPAVPIKEFMATTLAVEDLGHVDTAAGAR